MVGRHLTGLPQWHLPAVILLVTVMQRPTSRHALALTAGKLPMGLSLQPLSSTAAQTGTCMCWSPMVQRTYASLMSCPCPGCRQVALQLAWVAVCQQQCVQVGPLQGNVKANSSELWHQKREVKGLPIVGHQYEDMAT